MTTDTAQKIGSETRVDSQTPCYASASLKGRAEALQILLALDAELGLDDYIRSYPIADTGDYGAEWDEEKLKELFLVGNAYENSPFARLAQAAEENYWEYVAKKDDMRTLKSLVSRILSEIERGQIEAGPCSTIAALKTWVE